MQIQFVIFDGLRKVTLSKAHITIDLKDDKEFDLIYDPKTPQKTFRSREYGWGYQSQHKKFTVVVNENTLSSLKQTKLANLETFKSEITELFATMGLPIDPKKSVFTSVNHHPQLN